MFWQAVVLLFVGIIIILWGWRSENKSGQNMITALKGIAILRKEMDVLQMEVRSLESRIDQALEILLVILEKPENEQAMEAAAFETVAAEKQDSLFYRKSDGQKMSSSAKYDEVVILAQQGCTVTEIADKLAISQDAVCMVLNTQRRI